MWLNYDDDKLINLEQCKVISVESENYEYFVTAKKDSFDEDSEESVALLKVDSKQAGMNVIRQLCAAMEIKTPVFYMSDIKEAR